ncbi:hypothetical protein [Demequina sp.]|uniref:hypothetical protein n=1 Tax=Demequina sp. TaxID=2050685 RepID=UPI003A88FB63
MGRNLAIRTAETVGMGLIGDGVLGLLQPEQHVARWESGPSWWQRGLRPFVGNARNTRTFAAVEIVAGIALVWALPKGGKR